MRANRPFILRFGDFSDRPEGLRFRYNKAEQVTYVQTSAGEWKTALEVRADLAETRITDVKIETTDDR